MATGSLGLVGLSHTSLVSGQAATGGAAAEQARLGQPPGSAKVLQPGNPAEVGMSAQRLRRISHRLQVETGKRGVLSASILVARHGTVAWADPARQLICVFLSTRPATYQGGFLLNSISNMVQAAVVGR